MRRLFAVTVVVLAFGVVALSASAALNDAKGPKCVDITAGSFFYGSTGAFTGNVTLAGDFCKQVTYTLFILDESGDTTPLTTDIGEAGPAPDRASFNTTVNDADDFVCIYVETKLGANVRDRALDTGCLSVQKNGSPGGGGFN
jgi:hypothetical protein